MLCEEGKPKWESGAAFCSSGEWIFSDQVEEISTFSGRKSLVSKLRKMTQI